MSIPYYHVDVFTTEIFAGNPAGVCICSAFPAAETMQRIAAENRHSETAFVVQRPDRHFDLRWFTPKVEDDLCGHATLAAGFVLDRRAYPDWPLVFHTRSGALTVDRDGDGFAMDFPARPPQTCEPSSELLAALGLSHGTMMRSLRDYMVVVDSVDAVRRVSPDLARLERLESGIGGVIVTAAGTDGADYVCRFFPPAVGIAEDPATGSIQCTLAPYWGGVLGKETLSVRQLSTRGGAMRCQVKGDRVVISGAARLYLQGSIEL